MEVVWSDKLFVASWNKFYLVLDLIHESEIIPVIVS